jgi:hypothetical protein
MTIPASRAESPERRNGAKSQHKPLKWMFVPFLIKCLIPQKLFYN